ncbi:YdaU family protein [Aliihoeflea sp. PC F10.4]
MSQRPWMKFFPADYIADTTHMTTVQHGAYLLLIMHYWRNEGVPDDDQMLSRVTGLSMTEWRKMRPIIREMFNEGWRHKRIDRDIREAKEAYERRAKAGRKGGKTASNAQAMLKPSESESDNGRGQGTNSFNVEGSSYVEGRAQDRPRLAVVNGSFDTSEVPF